MPRLNTFNDVVKFYEGIKPVVSTNHSRSQDLRPVGKRSIKHERIKKISDTEYVLVCGIRWSTVHTRNNPVLDEYENLVAPIRWVREPDGDYIIVRNGAEGMVETGRYKFLLEHLPMAMHFKGSGRHKLVVHDHVYEFPKHKAKLVQDLRPVGNFPQGQKFLAPVGFTDEDNVCLKFRCMPDGTFIRVGKPLKVKVDRVDKQRKAELLPYIEAFYDQCLLMKDMLLSAADQSTLLKANYERLNESLSLLDNGVNCYWWRPSNQVPPEVAVSILMDETHPLRIPYMVVFMLDSGFTVNVESKEQASAIRSAFNRMVNRNFDLTKTEEV